MERYKVISLILLIWAVLASALAATFYMKARAGEAGLITVSIGFKVKDGPIEWHNSTVVEAGSTLLDLTCTVANVNYTTYPGMGAFVNCIGDLCSEHPYYWMWWYWTGDWYEGPVAADRYMLCDGDIVVWYYEDTSVSPLPKP